MRITDTTETAHFRSERFFCSNSEWFFSVRDDGEKGPFQTRREAEARLEHFLAQEIGIEYDAWSDPTLRR